jgi:L-lactate utilization protein LutC
MIVGSTASRAAILTSIQASLGRSARGTFAPIPDAARVEPRVRGSEDKELSLLLDEIEKLGGHARRIAGVDDAAAALSELVQAEGIRRATLWQTPEPKALEASGLLARLGVTVVPASAGKREIATCDLGVTGVDMALAETGTLVLRSGPDRSRLVSLVPRVHLALLRPSALRGDVQIALSEVKGERYWVFVTGPSRTSDIELVSTIGVHGPKALYVWLLPDSNG